MIRNIADKALRSTRPLYFSFSQSSNNNKGKFTATFANFKLKRILMQYNIFTQQTFNQNKTNKKEFPFWSSKNFQSNFSDNFEQNSLNNMKKASSFQNNIMIILALILLYEFTSRGDESNQTPLPIGSHISEQQAMLLLANGAVLSELEIISVEMGLSKNILCYMVSKTDGKTYYFQVIDLVKFLTQVENMAIDYKIKFQYRLSHEKPYKHFIEVKLYEKMLSIILISALIGFFWFIITRINSQNMGSMFGTEAFKKKFEAINPQNIKTKFEDVAGMHEAKKQITQFVDFLKQPDRYIELGAKVPKGALLAGPPGTGKTLIAKACAGQAGVPFFYVSGSEFVEKFVGLGANRVRQLFDQAQKNAPSIIFIDQIDAIGKKRDSGPFANEQRDNTLNQLLVRMDGFQTTNKVIVMAATNRKDMLDPALLRPGRFDRTVEIGLPNFQERKEILKVHLKKVTYTSSITIDELANKISILTPGFSGAQLSNVCNEAAILGARDNKDAIQIPHFEKAIQRVMAGLQKRNPFSQEEKDLLAYYESGKAVIGWFTEGADPLIKISILPFSKSSKGYSQQIKDESSLYTKQQLLDKVCFYLAGRAAQIHFKGYVTTNGDQDLKKAKRIITYIVTKFGMSDSLKMIAFPDIQFIRKPYSQKTQTIIDEQMNKILLLCKQKVQKIIEEKKQQIQAIRQKLLQKQTLTHDEIQAILGKREFDNNVNYRAFLKQREKQNKQQSPVSVQTNQ